LRRRVTDRLKRFKRDERGTGAVEFALLAPVLAVLAAGVVDTSRLILQSMQLRAAAQAGADYALRNPWNEAKVENAVIASGAKIAPTATAVLANKCLTAQGLTEAQTCTNGAQAGRFVTVTASSTYAPLFFHQPLLASRSLTATTVVRIP
jgi:Flp pilus assembly protein TadG